MAHLEPQQRSQLLAILTDEIIVQLSRSTHEQRRDIIYKLLDHLEPDMLLALDFAYTMVKDPSKL